jgi:hypothetical protein
LQRKWRGVEIEDDREVKGLTVLSWWYCCLIGHEGKISSVGGLVVSTKPIPPNRRNNNDYVNAIIDCAQCTVSIQGRYVYPVTATN